MNGLNLLVRVALLIASSGVWAQAQLPPCQGSVPAR